MTMTHQIWKKGWLKDKRYVRNPRHQLYNRFMDDLVRDLNDGLNRIIIIVGTPRSGKSFTSLWLQCFLNYCYFGREEYKPNPKSLIPLDDLYWKIDNFIKATKNPINENKFISMEEQGIEQYSKDWWKPEVQSFDKITQIFGVDNTNLIINLPYIFDLAKGTRLKGHYLLRAIKRSKTRVDVVICYKWMNITTEIAKYSPRYTWEKFPNVEELFPMTCDVYLEMKKRFNLTTKDNELKNIERIRLKNKPKLPQKPRKAYTL